MSDSKNKHKLNKDAPYKIITDDNQRVFDWVFERIGDGKYNWGGFSGIGVEQNGELVAGAMYDHYTHHSIAMHYAQDRPGRLYVPFLRLIFEYPFHQLKVHKIISFVNADTERIQRINQRLGFMFETRVSGVFADGHDLLIYSMTRENCRVLNMTHGTMPS